MSGAGGRWRRGWMGVVWWGGLAGCTGGAGGGAVEGGDGSAAPVVADAGAEAEAAATTDGGAAPDADAGAPACAAAPAPGPLTRLGEYVGRIEWTPCGHLLELPIGDGAVRWAQPDLRALVTLDEGPFDDPRLGPRGRRLLLGTADRIEVRDLLSGERWVVAVDADERGLYALLADGSVWTCGTGGLVRHQVDGSRLVLDPAPCRSERLATNAPRLLYVAGEERWRFAELDTGRRVDLDLGAIPPRNGLNEPGEATATALTPDGRVLLYQRWRTYEDGEYQELISMGAGPLHLFDLDRARPLARVHADFSAGHGGRPPAGGDWRFVGDGHLVDFYEDDLWLASDLRLRRAPPSPLMVLPAGRLLLVAGKWDEPKSLAIREPDGRTWTLSDRYSLSPAVSPDGGTLAFLEYFEPCEGRYGADPECFYGVRQLVRWREGRLEPLARVDHDGRVLAVDAAGGVLFHGRVYERGEAVGDPTPALTWFGADGTRRAAPLAARPRRTRRAGHRFVFEVPLVEDGAPRIEVAVFDPRTGRLRTVLEGWNVATTVGPRGVRLAVKVSWRGDDGRPGNELWAGAVPVP